MENKPRFSSQIRSFFLRLHPFRKLSVFLYDHFVPRGRKLKLTDAVDAVSCHQKDSTRTYLGDTPLTRPGYGEASLEETLNLTAAGEKESERVTIRISPKAYTSKQAQALLDQAETQLQKQLPGRNESLDDIRYPLRLPASLLYVTDKADGHA